MRRGPLWGRPVCFRQANHLCRALASATAGSIDANDLQAVLKSIGWDVDRKTAAEILSEGDFDHDGRVSLDEFLGMMAAEDKDPTGELLAAFRTFDTDGSGRISAEEFRATLEAVGVKHLTDADAAELMAEADVDHDGTIDYEEFVAAMAPSDA